eukprot:5314-Heterococcus_DN1.PRE.2
MPPCSTTYSVPGDTSALTPGGIRMGAPALTTRGFTEDDFEKVAEFFDRGVGIADAIKGKTGKLKDFKAALAKGADDFPELVQLAHALHSECIDLKSTSKLLALLN